MNASRPDDYVGKRQPCAVLRGNLRNLWLGFYFVANVHANLVSGAKILNSRVVTLNAACSPISPVSKGLAVVRMLRTSSLDWQAASMRRIVIRVPRYASSSEVTRCNRTLVPTGLNGLENVRAWLRRQT